MVKSVFSRFSQRFRLGQGLTGGNSFGLLTSWQARQSTWHDNGNGETIKDNSTFLQISPFLA